jgi:hypothetical protein
MPLLEKFNHTPLTSSEVKLDDRRRAEDFLEVARGVVSLAMSLREANAVAPAPADARPKDGNKKEAPETDEERARKAALALAAAWLRGTIRHVPTIAVLVDLFEQNPSLAMCAEDVATDVAERLRTFTWTDPKELKQLAKFVVSLPAFASPRIASAMLRNSSLDENAKLIEAMMGIVEQCLHDVVLEAELKDGGGDETVEVQEEVKGNPLLFDVLTAAKEWLRRSHQNEPVEKDADDDRGVFNWGGYPYKVRAARGAGRAAGGNGARRRLRRRSPTLPSLPRSAWLRWRPARRPSTRSSPCRSSCTTPGRVAAGGRPAIGWTDVCPPRRDCSLS